MAVTGDSNPWLQAMTETQEGHPLPARGGLRPSSRGTTSGGALRLPRRAPRGPKRPVTSDRSQRFWGVEGS